MAENAIRNKNGFSLSSLKENRVAMAYIIAVLLILLGGIINPGFLHLKHLLNILSLSSFLGIVVLSQTMVVLSGGEGIDLSVGAIISLSTVIASQVMNGSNARLVPAALIVLAVGFAIGLVNGAGAAFLKIPPLVMTLAMSSVVQGIALVYTQGQPKGRASSILVAAGSGRTGLIPNIVFVWIIVIAIAVIILQKTRTGKIVYGTGENDLTAELSGIRTKLVRFLVFGFSGMIAAFAGLCLLGYTGTSYLDLGSTYVMPTIAAAVIGGVALSGGNGSYLGAVAGTIVLTTLNSIMISLKSGEGGRQIVYGAVILVVLTIYSKRERR